MSASVRGGTVHGRRARAADGPAGAGPGIRRLLGVVPMLAGLWLLAAPFVLGYPTAWPHQRAFVVDLALGAAVASLAAVHLLAWRRDRRAAVGTLLLGLALLVAPVFLGYRNDPALSTAALNDVVVGPVVMLGAALALAASSSLR